MSKVTGLVNGVFETISIAFPATDGSSGSNGGSAEVIWNDTFNFSNLQPGDGYSIGFYMVSSSSSKTFSILLNGVTTIFTSADIANSGFGGVYAVLEVVKHDSVRCSYNIVLNGQKSPPTVLKNIGVGGAQYCSSFFKTNTQISFVLNSTGANQLYLRLVEVITKTKKPPVETPIVPDQNYSP